MTPFRDADPIDPAVRALLAALPDPPAPPMPDALRARLAAADAQAAPADAGVVVAIRLAPASPGPRAVRAPSTPRRRAWLVAAGLALAAVGAWRLAPPRVEAPAVVVAPAPVPAAPELEAALRELDAALTAAYATGADADEVAALWEARTALAASVPVDAAAPRLHPL